MRRVYWIQTPRGGSIEGNRCHTSFGEHSIENEDVPQMDWPSMFVYFGCCILLLLKKTGGQNYLNFMSTCIRELQGRAGCDPDA